jgi:uncharacterized tellurite resistance protein B-like protein
MESIEFKKLVLRTSFAVMACDGEIHPSEVKELRQISLGTKYLEGVDVDAELNAITAEFNSKKRLFFRENFKNLVEAQLAEGEKLIVMDVVLRMISADDRVDENEAKFLRALKKRLELSEELIRQRFGEVRELGIIKDQQYATVPVEDLVSSFSILDVPELKLSKQEKES